ncbi:MULTISPECIES: DUF6282 family protein [Pseudonocardia]|uniref:Amidohydrolase n=2 Tax=Pseudonocardia TaxID=1847 RepID=A0A1Y2MZV5_PSEAH|nr:MULTISPECIES: DUF6282 family protein [Pseudonocardia]OSY40387.1 hypothetical protein BG845_02791 [Pseudonocardia autotrophica]TDN72282.1 hypothetical protein C8E95_1338 [Pseudonocardia autotrophica]BBG02994.1 hypothetical protein Pdca_42030 [Pseudonocardia autotrophica]GEC25104.1 hypothetical protein PSA01_21330 [Pseudonocardia saturnea]
MPAHPPIAELLDGAVDLHCHSGPNPFAREFDHVEAARDAQRLNMRGILVKSHHHNTVMDLLAMKRELTDVRTPVFGGVALNAQVGGINPYAVAMSLRMGGRAVWFPTFSSRCHCENDHHGFPESEIDIPNRIVNVVDADGEFVDGVHEVIDLIVESDALMSAGHVSPAEARKLFLAGRDRGVRRMIISHPNFVIDADPAECVEFAELGAYVEHEVGMYDPMGFRKWDPQLLLDWIRKVGPDHTVLSSDLGQRGRPMPVDAFLRVGAELLDRGLGIDELKQVTSRNAAFLLGLDDERPAPVGS